MAETIIRRGARRGYTTVLRTVAQDGRLSLKALGLYVRMQSYPDDWKFTIAGLASVSRCGRDQIRAALAELEAVGYLVKAQSHDEGGKFSGAVYVLQEEAPPLSENPTTVRRKNEPLSENPLTGKPTTENPTLINNINNKTTPRIPPEGDAAFDRFWARYPRKQDKAKARRAWAKLAPDRALADRIMAALEIQRRSESWTREGGRYIPMPSTWLNGRRWEDELPPGPDRRPPAREEYGWQ